MIDYKSNIEPFLEDTRKPNTTNKTLKDKWRYINLAIDFLSSQGLEKSNDNYYSNFANELKCKYNLSNSTIKPIIIYTRNFFKYCEKQEENLQMNTENTTTEILEAIENEGLNARQQQNTEIEQSTEQGINPCATGENNAQSPSLQSSESDNTVVFAENQKTQTPKGRPGRKRKDTENGEIRSEKIMLYLTPSTYANVKALSRLCDMPVTDYIISVIQRETEKFSKELNNMEQIRNRILQHT